MKSFDEKLDYWWQINVFVERNGNVWEGSGQHIIKHNKYSTSFSKWKSESFHFFNFIFASMKLKLVKIPNAVHY